MATAREEQKEAQANAARATASHGDDPGLRSWPFDQNGDPMVEISIEGTELIGLKDYSNIVILARARTLVSLNEANPFTEKQLKNVASAFMQLGEAVEVDVVAELREIALNSIDPSKRHD